MEQKNIISMFNSIASTYDRANRLISLGSDTLWRKKACKLCKPFLQSQNLRVLDVACGTGDMLKVWERFCKDTHINIEPIGVDPAANMLNIARSKLPHAHFLEAEATDMPIEDNKVDIVSIAYGIRNVLEPKKALLEFHRVLKDKGLLLILEFTKVEKFSFFSYISYLYSRYILPILGGAISLNFSAYNYLPKSIGSFLNKSQMTKEIQEAGFEVLLAKELFANVSCVFIAQKINK